MIRNFAVAMVLVSSFATTAAFAAPATTVAATTVAAKVQTIRFTLRNDSSSDLMLSTGQKQLTVKSGKSVDLKLAVGQKITAASDCGRYAQGDVVSTVADIMNGNTLAIR